MKWNWHLVVPVPLNIPQGAPKYITSRTTFDIICIELAITDLKYDIITLQF